MASRIRHRRQIAVFGIESRSEWAYYPNPTSAGNPFTHVNNGFAQGSNHSGSNQLGFKIDENISDKARFSARYSLNWGDSQPFNALGNEANGALPDTSRTQNGVVDYTRTQNPTTVINLRASVTRAHERHVPAGSFEQTSLGFPSILDYSGVNMSPRITTSGHQSLGVGGYALIWRDEDIYVASGSVTKIWGVHTVKTGLEVRRLHIAPGYPDGTLWDSTQRPNLIGNPSMPGPVHDRLDNYFNVKAFADVDADTYGSAPRLLSNYRAPGIKSGDLTLAKSFAIQEHRSLQLRLESYNFENTPQFAGAQLRLRRPWLWDHKCHKIRHERHASGGSQVLLLIHIPGFR